MYHILIKRQIIRLYNDISKVEMGKIIILKINCEFKKSMFFYFFWPAIPHLIISFNHLNFTYMQLRCEWREQCLRFLLKVLDLVL